MQKTLYPGSYKRKGVKRIYVDGGTRCNQICLVNGSLKIVKKRKGRLSNNELEYLAMIYGLEYAIHHFPQEIIHLHSDSKLIVNQLQGKWRVTNQNLFLLHVKAGRLIEKHGGVKLVWTPREFNLAGVHLEELGK